MSKQTPKITSVSGRAIPVRGDDIDTDRIIPARYLRCVTFDGIEEHVFEDDRSQLREQGALHSFDDPRFAGASILLVNRNFGCGSSREHAPQAIRRWGIRAIVGESFAEIFFGNCVAMGLPCLTVAKNDIDRLMTRIAENPAAEVAVDVAGARVSCAELEISAVIPDGPREAFVEGLWDATGQLLYGFEHVRHVAATLPYTTW